MTHDKPLGILFDLDGTLLDSLADIAREMNAILAEDGLPTHDHAAYRYFIGGGARHLAHQALPENRRDQTEAYLDRFQRLYRQNLIVETALYPGILELLRALRDRPMPMAVLSNKPHDMTRVLVDHFLDEVPFVAVAGAVDGKPKKPDPVFAAPLLGALGLPPERVLMVGDTKTDMLTARATGMRGVGVSWGFRDRAELEEHGAECVIDSAAALLDLL
ncbi:MAG: HAD family hydrolase [Deltaproteobacteria bacterium]|nr:HAD family hydrolase [Deltaproteobacteria bacterium]